MEVGDKDVDVRGLCGFCAGAVGLVGVFCAVGGVFLCVCSAMSVGEADHWEEGAEKVAKGEFAIDAKAGEDGGGFIHLFLLDLSY